MKKDAQKQHFRLGFEWSCPGTWEFLCLFFNILKFPLPSSYTSRNENPKRCCQAENEFSLSGKVCNMQIFLLIHLNSHTIRPKISTSTLISFIHSQKYFYPTPHVVQESINIKFACMYATPGSALGRLTFYYTNSCVRLMSVHVHPTNWLICSIFRWNLVNFDALGINHFFDALLRNKYGIMYHCIR